MEVANVLIILALLTIINMRGQINRFEDQIKGRKHTMDQVTDHLNLPENPINNELRKLIGEGEEIEAVKKGKGAFRSIVG